MPEYIEREALLRALSKEVGYNDDGDQEINSDTVFIAIESAPAADVAEVVHGEWKLLDECSNAGVYCSICHKAVYRESAWYKNVHIKSKYCPNCGAKMDKEDET